MARSRVYVFICHANMLPEMQLATNYEPRGGGSCNLQVLLPQKVVELLPLLLLLLLLHTCGKWQRVMEESGDELAGRCSPNLHFK